MHPINRLLAPLGVQLHRRPTEAPRYKSDYVRMLEHFEINLILDVGAHEGAGAQRLFETGYRGRVVSFEPVSTHFKELTARVETMKKAGHAWEARNHALGDADVETEINISINGLSSSIADMLPAHEHLNADSKYVRREKIVVQKLDSILSKIARPDDRVLLLLDVQGFEPQALAGAANSLPRLCGVQLEIGFRPTYATGFDMPAAFTTMAAHGFTPCYVEPAWKDPVSCVFYQVDVLWFREPAVRVKG